jgi:hypothetical protein
MTCALSLSFHAPVEVALVARSIMGSGAHTGAAAIEAPAQSVRPADPEGIRSAKVGTPPSKSFWMRETPLLMCVG